ncbi:HD domain-containing protein [Paenibacillus ehimensis]|uniref:HD domain-containing protein n=1 Tax=Paenibacillus ehimensis TaxID=79264 RepID=UPI000FD7E64E|nr:HD domain-containing protein [Paenibacillus ehimensis]
MRKEIAGIVIPDTKLAKEATELVREVSPVSIFNHALRSYIFGAALGNKLNKKYDAEMLYLSAIMHDLGVVERFIGPARFEIDGADAAADFLTKHQYPAEKIALVWDAIALHTSVEIAIRKAPEVALVQMGTFTDVGFLDDGMLPASFLEEIFEAVPLLGFHQAFTEAVTEVLRRKPHTAYVSFLADIVRNEIHGEASPKVCSHIPRPPFDNQA